MFAPVKANFLLLSLLTILSAGCASNRVLVSTRHDAHFSPTPADKISMALRPNPSAEDAALGSVLLAELARENFNIVTNVDADYVLAYLVEDDSTENYVPARDYAISAPSQTSKDIIASGLPAPPGFTRAPSGFAPSAGATIIVYHNKGIRLYLYANPKKYPGLQIAWEGCIEAGESIPAEREAVLIRTLLGYFGQDYIGRVTPPQ